MNVKTKASLLQMIRKIERNEFDETDIKVLLIDVREFLKEETFLREVADFVAHSERNKGLCHQSVNTRYAKMKMHAIGTDKLIKTNQFQLHPDKPWRFFSNQILGYINTLQIEHKMFKLFVLDSLEDLPDETFKKYYQKGKKEIQEIIKRSYFKKDGYYFLRETLSIKEIWFIDEVLKFIRGTIVASPIIDQAGLATDLNRALQKITNNLGLPLSYKTAFNEHIEDIIVCIICLLHDCSFVMYDGTRAKGYMSFHPETDQDNESSFYSIALMAETAAFSFPIITTGIHSNRYLEDTLNLSAFDLKRIPWVQTIREAHQLRLIISPSLSVSTEA